MLAQIIGDAIEELQEWREENPRGDAHDHIAEIADSAVPVYHGNLLACVNEDMSLLTDEPELGPAFDGAPTPVNIIAANVYERVSQALWEALPTLEEEEEDDSEV